MGRMRISIAGAVAGVALMVSNASAADPRSADITRAVHRAMRFLEGKEAAGGLHYSDYVVFCGRPIEKALPEYKDMMDAYRKWIGEHDAFEKDYLYPSAC